MITGSVNMRMRTIVNVLEPNASANRVKYTGNVKAAQSRTAKNARSIRHIPELERGVEYICQIIRLRIMKERV